MDGDGMGEDGADHDTGGYDIGGHDIGDRGIDAFIGYATAHGETSDTRQVIGDLGDMLRTAWRLLSPAQRVAFCEDADVLGIAEAAGGSGAGANG